MSRLYAGFLWGVITFGILILLFGPADGPAGILDVLAFLSTFAMGAYCIVLLLVNNRLLPKPIRPGIGPEPDHRVRCGVLPRHAVLQPGPLRRGCGLT